MSSLVQPRSVPPAARVRILIVDDSAASRQYIESALAELPDIELTTVDSGAKALLAIRAGGYSLVLCDYEMPDMSGLQVLGFVRRQHTAVELPVLMLTRRDEAEIKVRAFRAGANDYIAKHALPEELQARVRTQIELLQAHRRLLEARLRVIEGQKFEAVGHLAEALGHELNTPAQYIGDNLSFLAEGFEALGNLVDTLRANARSDDASALDRLLASADFAYFRSEIPRCIEESRQGIEQVARIVAVMRDFGRKGAQEETAQDLNEIVRGALAVTRGQWQLVADLQLELENDLPPVQCVGAAIKQVVLYAIVNAAKAMTALDGVQRERGTLRLRTSQAAHGLIGIEIADTGRSLGQATLDKVLDPVLGSSVDGEVAQALRHARAVIVDEHGGTLEIESLEGTGTRLRIQLPLWPERRRVGEALFAPK